MPWQGNITTMMSHDHYGISGHCQLDCLCNSLFSIRTKKYPHYRPLSRDSTGMPADPPHKWSVMLKSFPCHDISMLEVRPRLNSITLLTLWYPRPHGLILPYTHSGLMTEICIIELFQLIVWFMFCLKPLTELYAELMSIGPFCNTCGVKIKDIVSRKWFLKCWLQNFGHFYLVHSPVG